MYKKPIRLPLSYMLRKKRRKKNYASSKKLLTSIKEKGPLGKKRPFTRKEKRGSVRITRVAGRQASRPLLIGLEVGRTLKRTPGLNKLTSIVHRMSMLILCSMHTN